MFENILVKLKAWLGLQPLESVADSQVVTRPEDDSDHSAALLPPSDKSTVQPAPGPQPSSAHDRGAVAVLPQAALDNQALREENVDLWALAQSSDREVARLRMHVSQLEHERFALAHVARTLRDGIGQRDKLLHSMKGATDAFSANVAALCRTAYPTGYSEMGQWVDTHYADRLLILPRALRAVKKSTYENPELVYRALEFLATDYHALQRGDGSKHQQQVQDALQGMGLRNSRSYKGDGIGLDESYAVDWRGRRRMLGMHLKRGVGQDPKTMLRIYYFWCPETQRPVIGHLTSHLRNRLTC